MIIKEIIKNNFVRPDRELGILKHYHKPSLVQLGDLRTFTLGGSPGAGESHGSKPTKRKVH